jgi:hypothetical protein
MTMLTLSDTNLRTWQEAEVVRTHCTTRQRLLWLRDSLPEVELLAIARDELFRPLAAMVKRRRRSVAAVEHPRGPGGIWICITAKTPVIRNVNDMIQWSTTPHPDLSKPQRDALDEIQEAASEISGHPWLWGIPSPVSVEPRLHEGACRMCQRKASDKSALVTVRWAGRTLSREYAL